MPKSGASTYLNHRAIMGVDGYVVSHLATIIADHEKVLTDFLYEILVLVKLQDIKVNSDYPSLNINDIENIKIPLPPLDVQQQIVAECEKVDEEYNTVQKTIEENKRKIEKLMSEVKGEMKRLGSLVEISRGASPRPINKYLTEDSNGVNWIKIGDVAVGEKYITKTAQKITKEGAEKSKYVKPGDFIISNSMSTGRPYILKISGCIHDGWLLMSNISERINKDYFYYILSSSSIQKQFTENALGGVVQNLNTTRVSTIQIPVPSFAEQQHIVQEIENYEAAITAAKAVVATCAEKKKMILDKWL